jgi:hypothetical protein
MRKTFARTVLYGFIFNLVFCGFSLQATTEKAKAKEKTDETKVIKTKKSKTLSKQTDVPTRKSLGRELRRRQKAERSEIKRTKARDTWKKWKSTQIKSKKAKTYKEKIDLTIPVKTVLVGMQNYIDYVTSKYYLPVGKKLKRHLLSAASREINLKSGTRGTITELAFLKLKRDLKRYLSLRYPYYFSEDTTRPEFSYREAKREIQRRINQYLNTVLNIIDLATLKPYWRSVKDFVKEELAVAIEERSGKIAKSKLQEYIEKKMPVAPVERVISRKKVNEITKDSINLLKKKYTNLRTLRSKKYKDDTVWGRGVKRGIRSGKFTKTLRSNITSAPVTRTIYSRKRPVSVAQ